MKKKSGGIKKFIKKLKNCEKKSIKKVEKKWGNKKKFGITMVYVHLKFALVWGCGRVVMGSSKGKQIATEARLDNDAEFLQILLW